MPRCLNPVPVPAHVGVTPPRAASIPPRAVSILSHSSRRIAAPRPHACRANSPQDQGRGSQVNPVVHLSDPMTDYGITAARPIARMVIGQILVHASSDSFYSRHKTITRAASVYTLAALHGGIASGYWPFRPMPIRPCPIPAPVPDRMPAPVVSQVPSPFASV